MKMSTQIMANIICISLHMYTVVSIFLSFRYDVRKLTSSKKKESNEEYQIREVFILQKIFTSNIPSAHTQKKICENFKL